MRRPVLSTAVIGAVVTAVLAASTAVVLTSPAPAHADETVVAGGIGTAEQASVQMSVPVPRGLRPSAVTGRLTADAGLRGLVTFTIADRVARRVPARTGAVRIPVTVADVGTDRMIRLQMTYDATERCPTGSGPAPVRFSGLRLTYTGAEVTPSGLDDFFPPAPPRIDVVVPAAASDDALSAGLVAVTALSRRYGAGTTVVLSTADRVLPRLGPGQRVVRIEALDAGDVAATTAVSRRFGLVTATLRGSGTPLREAAQALGGDGVLLAGGEATTGLSARVTPRDTSLERTFAELGSDTITLTGPAPSSVALGVRQDVFGGPVESLRVVAKGTHSAVPPGTEAQLDVYANGYLLDSQLLDDSPELEVDVTVPAGRLSGDTSLLFVLTSGGEGQSCAGTGSLPVRVYVDGSRSTVTAERGVGESDGFGLFPQALGGELPVAVRGEGRARVQAAIDAAHVLTALQRAAAGPLAVELVDADEFVGGTRSGLLVGATRADTRDLDAPLRLDGMRLVDYAEQEFEVGSDQPYAALEAVHADGRHVLVLGGWAPDDATDQVAPLSRRAALFVSAGGWGRLSDDVLVAVPERTPFAVGSDSVVPQAERIDERRAYAGWLVGGLLVLLLLLAWQVGRTARRDRRVRELVNAQVIADRPTDADDGPPSSYLTGAPDDPRRSP